MTFSRTHPRVRPVRGMVVMTAVCACLSCGSAASPSVSPPVGLERPLSSGGIGVGPDGLVYFVALNRVMKLSTAGKPVPVAGSGKVRFSGDGGPAAQAGLGASALAFTPEGRLVIADAANNRVREVSADGTIRTIAGVGPDSPGDELLEPEDMKDPGFSGDGGPAAKAELYEPNDITVDRAGNIYVADFGNGRIRKIDTGGRISTIAGRGRDLDVATPNGDGGPATRAVIEAEGGIAIDYDNNIYVSEGALGRIRQITPQGKIDTIAGTGEVEEERGSFEDELAEGESALNARLAMAAGLDIDADGSVYIAEREYNTLIRKVNPDGIINTIAGSMDVDAGENDGPALATRLNHPRDVAITKDGMLYLLDETNSEEEALSIRRIDPKGHLSTITTLPNLDPAR